MPAIAASNITLPRLPRGRVFVGAILLPLSCLGILLLSVEVILANDVSRNVLDRSSNIVTWDRTYEESGYSFRHNYSYVSARSGHLVVGGIYFSSGMDLAPENALGLWLWVLKSDGERLIDIRIPRSEGKLEFAEVEALAELEEGRFLLVARDLKETTHLVLIGRDGEILKARPLKFAQHINRVIQSSSGKSLMIGHESEDALIILVDGEGRTLWEKTYDRGRFESFLDGIWVDGNGFILVENSGTREPFFMAESSIWLARYTGSGTRGSEVSFPGRWGSIATSGDSGFSLVYDVGTGGMQDVWVKHFDWTLRDSWRTQVSTSSFSLSPVFAGPDSGGGTVVLVAKRNKRPHLSLISKEGVVISAFDGDALPPSGNTTLASGGGGVSYLVMSSLGLSQKSTLSSKIRVLRLAAGGQVDRFRFTGKKSVVY